MFKELLIGTVKDFDVKWDLFIRTCLLMAVLLMHESGKQFVLGTVLITMALEILLTVFKSPSRWAYVMSIGFAAFAGTISGQLQYNGTDIATSVAYTYFLSSMILVPIFVFFRLRDAQVTSDTQVFEQTENASEEEEEEE